MGLKKFDTGMTVMRMLTDNEYQSYKNHNCQDFVSKGIVFNYNKMDEVNKKYSEAHSDKLANASPETPSFQSPDDLKSASQSLESSIPIAPSSDTISGALSAPADRKEELKSKMADTIEQVLTDENLTKNNDDSVSNAEKIPLDDAATHSAGQSSEELPRTSKIPIPKKFFCELCGSNFTKKYSLKRHITLGRCKKVKTASFPTMSNRKTPNENTGLPAKTRNKKTSPQKKNTSSNKRLLPPKKNIRVLPNKK